MCVIVDHGTMIIGYFPGFDSVQWDEYWNLLQDYTLLYITLNRGIHIYAKTRFISRNVINIRLQESLSNNSTPAFTGYKRKQKNLKIKPSSLIY